MRFIKFLKVSDKRHGYGNIQNKYNIFDEICSLDKILANFKSVFGLDDTIILLDNSSDETFEKVKSFGFCEIIRTSLGPHDSTKFLFDKIVSEYNDDDVIYLCEDDYWHLSDSPKIIIEGLERAPFVTLYDSLDKYVNHSVGGANPQITESGERTLVYITESCHWKFTNATTMTFAAKVSSFKQHHSIMSQYYTSDYAMFCLLRTQGFDIGVCIPGRSSHIGYEMSPYTNWIELIKQGSDKHQYSEHDITYAEWRRVTGR